MTQKLNEQEKAALNHVDDLLAKSRGQVLQVSERHLETLQELAARARVFFIQVKSQRERTFSWQGLRDLRDAYKEANE